MVSNMKVILATGIFPPDIGGPATYCERLAQGFHKMKINVAVICYSDVKKDKEYEFPVIRISRRYPKGLRHLLYFYHSLKLARGTDVIYAQNPVTAGFPAMLASKILAKKFVLKIVGDYAWEQGRSRWGVKENIEDFQNKKYNWKIELLKKIQKLVTKNANEIIIPSHYLKKIVNNWKKPSQNLKVIYNAKEDLNSNNISVSEAKKRIEINGDIILSAGRLISLKGFDALIEIMPDLLKENSNFQLVIIGNGPEKKNLESKIKNLKLENNIKLAGRVKHCLVPLYFKAADIFVLNTAHEGLPHVVLEAMQLETPVITTKVGGNPELIQDGFNGFLVEYNNQDRLKEAILKLWKDKNLQKKFIQNSRQKLKKFNWENLIENTLNLLKSI